MNVWLIGAIGLLIAMIPCGIVALRGSVMDRLIAVDLCGTLAVLTLLLLAQGTQRPSFDDLALTLALLSFPGSLAFARLLRRGHP